MSFRSLFLGLSLIATSALAADPLLVAGDKFRQLEELLPTPNSYRTASGAPGHQYWQQQADYHIDVTLDDANQSLSAKEIITYTNNSPDSLRYLWLQLDANRFRQDSMANRMRTVSVADEGDKANRIDMGSYRRELMTQVHPSGINLTQVSGKGGQPLKYTLVDTLMRVDLPTALKPGQSFELTIGWQYRIHEQKALGGRSGYEYFERDDNYLYEVAQWFPRMAVYSDAHGWHNKPFLRHGEFTLEFGDYEVNITVPADHVVTATGTLSNPEEVLTRTQRQRLEQAREADKPVYIITKEEALENEQRRSKGTKTWRFKADQVRDFAWASSRKFLWDAQGYKKGGTDTLAMSFYPEEATPLWDKYSTAAIVHTIDVYNSYSFDYPYPVAISVNGPVGGMEYPMLSFNGPRPEINKEDRSDRTWSRRTKYGLITVIIHEVGHNYFPMIVNSDERQWTWMDEGLNTFVQYLAQQAWEEEYPSKGGEPQEIISYMKSEGQVPIMTNSESILQFGNNAYAKPATALNILRETILGRDLFDFAFREYAERWKFKRPMPADFFRTMEDASGIDLDWFWRGWFYTTDHVDISIDRVRHFTVNTKDPDIESQWQRQQHQEKPETITELRNQGMPRFIDGKPEQQDFYNEHDQFTATNKDRNDYAEMLAKLEPFERELLQDDHNVYLLDFSNLGGLVMPIILELSYDDGSIEPLILPAEIWVKNAKKVTKMLVRPMEKRLISVVVDPHWQTADTNVDNNHYPRQILPSRLELFKEKKKKNMMQKYAEPLKEDAKENQ
ncbi:M1 family metallopeptidase [Ferrimonas sp. YFM]|uniref:M1 family metallopeptidase n=1 Tax=Ferrimonas sp. YFM TaxID=3028878 RepID=UPI00257281D8|nr:M1 family metallopeptidase [Ferrimonas sp. YFM]BDY04372.1 aminopeptidase [Ferrimonas sp. YFM]